MCMLALVLGENTSEERLCSDKPVPVNIDVLWNLATLLHTDTDAVDFTGRFPRTVKTMF